MLAEAEVPHRSKRRFLLEEPLIGRMPSLGAAEDGFRRLCDLPFRHQSVCENRRLGASRRHAFERLSSNLISEVTREFSPRDARDLLVEVDLPCLLNTRQTARKARCFDHIVGEI